MAKFDVVVVGAGNAAFCAAQAAAEKGAKVLMVERAPKELMGGNSRFTAGAFRCVYDGVDDLKAIMPDLTRRDRPLRLRHLHPGPVLRRHVPRHQYRTDGELCDRLVGRSRDAMRWLHGKGMKFDPIWGRQAYLIDGKFKFWGGLTVESKGGGPGLSRPGDLKLAEKNGIEIRYGVRGLSLIYDGAVVKGVHVKANGKLEDIECRSVVLACGGFESNAEMRARYLGPGLGARQGSRHAATTPATASTWRSTSARRQLGHWSGGHAVRWDRNAPDFGDLAVGDDFQKHSYPWASWSTPPASVSSTRAPTSATTPTRSTAA